ncbi:MAG: 50S ribosomal protein L24 [Rickettsiales bacterium]|nr:50S ribosomal protein L24 [Rickettsiales bacterium]|tara:strand:- start:43745 stop:44053 length:309 start_codon:yes stop_codon:yes gene_type:complete
MKIKKGDTVIVTCGKDKGKDGQVIKVFPQKNKALVQGINMVKKHTKPSANSKGGIESIEMPINVSNLLYLDPKTNKGSKIGYKFLDDGKKVRFLKKSGETIT